MRNRKRILVVEEGTPSNTGRLFADSGHEVKTTESGSYACQEVAREQYDLVLADLKLPVVSGLELMKRILELRESPPVILMSAGAGVAEAVEAMKLGARDFLIKPLTTESVEVILRQLAAGNGGPSGNGRNDRSAIITRNPQMKGLLRQAREIADSRASVFIQGESGTGKELFARYIHRHSQREDRAFVAVNCAALPENLLESELFGHEKGAFTGALVRKKGKFELAHQGTLLLDEISEMDYRLQSKLLRVVQEKEIDRLGGAVPVPVDVRIIATTNVEIHKSIQEGRFREDLYFRLSVVPFHLPPLRERREDIEILARHFIDKYNLIDGRRVKGLTDEAVASLIQRPWKGNVRELENTIERAVLLCAGEYLDKSDLVPFDRRDDPRCEPSPPVRNLSLREMEKNAIFHALDRTNGNRTHAAEMLGISVRTLRNKLNEYKERMEIQ